MKQPVKAPPQVRAGVDVGATELVVAILRDGPSESPCTVPNTPAGHRQLLKLLTRRRATARVCLEVTGVYSLRLALALQRAKRVDVMVVNPRAIKDFQRARLTRAKTDRVDALGILEFLQRMTSCRGYRPRMLSWPRNSSAAFGNSAYANAASQ